jgi:hypothetical protein
MPGWPRHHRARGRAVTGGDRHLCAKSTRLEPIDDETYGALTRHFMPQQTIDICLTVGLSNMINRFHATSGRTSTRRRPPKPNRAT